MMDVTLSPRARATVVWIGVALALLIFVLASHALTPTPATSGHHRRFDEPGEP
jgi:hypothetical protein